MTHHQNTIHIGHDLPQGMGFHPGFHAGAFLRMLRFAAVERQLAAIFDHYLIAAPAQGQLNSRSGIFRRLGKTGCVETQTNA